MTSAPVAARRELASADDVRQILGALDPDKVLDIIALQPTIRDLEDVSTFLSGDADVFGAGNPLQSPAGDIVAILTADEEDEEGA